jgi:hypothetical protein
MCRKLWADINNDKTFSTLAYKKHAWIIEAGLKIQAIFGKGLA